MTSDAAKAEAGRPTAGSRHHSRHDSGERPGPTIAIVEDQQAIAEMLVEILTGHGFHPVRLVPPYGADRIATSGAAVLLLDIVLGRDSGWDLLDDVRTDPATRDLPTIITSALYDRPGLHTLPAGGPIVFMPKPFDIDDLIATIQRLTDINMTPNH